MYKILLTIIPLCALLGCSGVDEEALLKEINSVPMLYTAEAVAEVYVEQTDESSSLKSFFGSRDIIVPVRANLKAGVDLSKITEIKVEGGVAKLKLPDPIVEIESTKILNNEIVSMVSGLRSSFTSREEGELAKLGRDKIKSKLGELGLVESAQEQAEQIISKIIRKLGYEPEISKKQYSPLELPQLIKVD